MNLTPELLMALGLNLLIGGVAWGALRSEVHRLRKDVDGLSDLGERMVRMETKQDAMIEQMRDLNASIRWMREPADYGPNVAGKGPKRPA